MALEVDKFLHNADWTKQVDDLQMTDKQLKKFLKRMGMSVSKFKKLPAYRFPKKRRKL